MASGDVIFESGSLTVYSNFHKTINNYDTEAIYVLNGGDLLNTSVNLSGVDVRVRHTRIAGTPMPPREGIGVLDPNKQYKFVVTEV